MKCGYNKCNLGGEVSKEEGVKEGNRWYHKECLAEKNLKKEIEEYYRNHFNDREPLQNIRIAISNYIHKQGYEAEYVLWCLKNKAQKLNSMYGLSYTLSYKQNEVEFKKWRANQVKIEFDDYNDEYFDELPKYKSKEDKGWNLW